MSRICHLHVGSSTQYVPAVLRPVDEGIPLWQVGCCVTLDEEPLLVTVDIGRISTTQFLMLYNAAAARNPNDTLRVNAFDGKGIRKMLFAVGKPPITPVQPRTERSFLPPPTPRQLRERKERERQARLSKRMKALASGSR